MGVCHRISSPRGGGLVTLTVTNPHLAPPMPVWGVVGHNIDRCINLGGGGGGSWVSFFFWGGGGRGELSCWGEGGGASPATPSLLDETLLEGIMKNPMEPCTCCCITHRR